jgi:DNA gyrase/topoisomerase IV subunit A
METLPQAGEVFMLAMDGSAKRVPVSQFPKQGRYGQGVVAWKLLPKARAIGMVVGKGTQRVTLHLSKLAPKVIRLDDALLQTRAARGGKLQSLKAGEQVLLLTTPWDWERALIPSKRTARVSTQMSEEESTEGPVKGRAKAAKASTGAGAAAVKKSTVASKAVVSKDGTKKTPRSTAKSLKAATASAKEYVQKSLELDDKGVVKEIIKAAAKAAPGAGPKTAAKKGKATSPSQGAGSVKSAGPVQSTGKAKKAQPAASAGTGVKTKASSSAKSGESTKTVAPPATRSKTSTTKVTVTAAKAPSKKSGSTRSRSAPVTPGSKTTRTGIRKQTTPPPSSPSTPAKQPLSRRGRKPKSPA